jgi:hypothetical protein
LNGEALVSYGGFTIATGSVPGFCVSGKGDRVIQFLASAMAWVCRSKCWTVWIWSGASAQRSSTSR